MISGQPLLHQYRFLMPFFSFLNLNVLEFSSTKFSFSSNFSRDKTEELKRLSSVERQGMKNVNITFEPGCRRRRERALKIYVDSSNSNRKRDE